MEYSLIELAELCEGKAQDVSADAAKARFKNIDNLSSATAESIALYSSKAYLADLKSTKAGAILTSQKLSEDCVGNCKNKGTIIVDNPLLALAKIMTAFDPPAIMEARIAKTAKISSTAVLGKELHIGPHTVIGKRTVLGDGVKIGAGCTIADDVTIGEGSIIDARVVVYQRTAIGKHCHFSSGAVIGADGFGFAETSDEAGNKWLPIPQSACVKIGNNVHIGANTTIDRGSLADTLIEDGVIIDNLVQIGHNAHIGRHTAIAACTGVAGSAHIGSNCKIGGCCAIAGHIQICDGVTVLGNSLITKSILAADVYSSSMPAMPAKLWRIAMAKFRRSAKK